MLEKFGLPVHLREARMYTDDFHAMQAGFPPAQLVPAARLDRAVVYDALALAEALNARHPEAAMRPSYPTPPRLPASSVSFGPSENALCLYSGKPVTHFMELDGRVFGFCNVFCRDKTVADAAV